VTLRKKTPPRKKPKVDEVPAAARELLARIDIAQLVGHRILIYGWILGFGGPKLSAAVYLDTNEIDLLARAIRIRRADVAQHFSIDPDGAEHGFYVLVDLKNGVLPPDQLRLEITEPSGEISESSWTIESQNSAALLVQQPQSTTIQSLMRLLPPQEMVRLSKFLVEALAPPTDIENEFRLEIDSPAQHQGAALAPVWGSLRVEGWALARAGLAVVQVYVDDLEAGEASYGVRREDVAAVCSDWSDALMCGFGLSVPGKLLSSGNHVVCVVVRDRIGRESSRAFTIVVERPAEIGWTEILRSRVPEPELHLDRLVLSSLQWEPYFDLYMHVRNSDPEAIRATIATLRDQQYKNWQLTIVDEKAGLANDTRDSLLRGFPDISADSRVEIVRGFTRGSSKARVSVNSDPMLCGLLSPGDRLGRDALLEIALETGQHADVEFIYTDERRTDPVSGRIAPYFKPAWSPDLLFSTNYIGRFWVARASLVHRAKIQLEHPAAGEYETVLRLTHAANKIAHLPKVLCERGQDTSEDAATECAAIRQAAERSGFGGEVLPGCAPGMYRLKRTLKENGLVSIVIPTCGSRDLIRNCIKSIREVTSYRNFEVICIENVSSAKTSTRRWIKSNADKTITTTEPFNWSRFNNEAAKAASSNAAYLLFLNDDVGAFEADWLSALLEHAQQDEIGVTGALLLYPDRTIQHAGLHTIGIGLGRHAHRFSQSAEPGAFGHALTQRNVLAVTGACMLIKRAFFESVGGFDEAHSIINNDLDFCLRAVDRGKRIVYTPYAKLIHYEMASRSSISDLYEIQSFDSAWGQKCAEGDPYYNPLLSRSEINLSADLEPVQVVYGGRPLTHGEGVQSILAIKLDHIGDFITAFPAFRRIKQRFPKARLVVLASSASTQLAALEPSIDEWIEFNFFAAESSRGQLELSEVELTALQERLTARRFDIAIDLRKHPETRELLRRTNARLTAGFDSGSRFPWLDVALEWENDSPVFGKRQHISDDLLRLVEAVSVACESDRRSIGEIAAEPAEVQAFADLLDANTFDKPVVCIHPSAGNPLRTWHPRHFAELIDLILLEFDVSPVLIGSKGDEETIKKVMAALLKPNLVTSLAGRLPLGMLPHFLARCALVIGNNSGPQHLAAGLGVPTLGIYSGVVDAREWAPLGPAAVAIRRDMICSPCYFAQVQQCHRGVACLNDLKPGDILATCRKLLAIRAGSARRDSTSTMTRMGRVCSGSFSPDQPRA
jgi:ADP-heptose:LPS heptosyltransferase/GT2 family glycosyltransferase